jgi:hypothetical protein
LPDGVTEWLHPSRSNPETRELRPKDINEARFATARRTRLRGGAKVINLRQASASWAAAALALACSASALATEPYGVTPISGTYIGNQTGSEFSCATTRSWAGYRPTTPGTYPVHVYVPSMFSTPTSPETLKEAEEFAKRGFIAVSFDYPNSKLGLHGREHEREDLLRLRQPTRLRHVGRLRVQRGGRDG